ncbi:sulfur reduction protein DsrE [SAR202 cluster bacterium AD-804-J14_MRT_500m]|nr:sulfur reduction protein DsrE [SAR202 cluster bacterium AD-804-J14_MRT_500m]
MSTYVLIESRDPFEYGDSRYMYHMANDLARKGNDVILFLIQNGVLTTRSGVKNNPLAELSSSSGVRVLADEFSLRERGILRSGLVDGVTVSDVDSLVDFLVQDDTKIVWH